MESAGYLKRAKPKKLKEVFEKYASIQRNGEKYMSSDDFVKRYLKLYDENQHAHDDVVQLLANILDSDKDGLISYEDFEKFEEVLCMPDALFKTAFKLCDTRKRGSVGFYDFHEVMKHSMLIDKYPINTDSELVNFYFGKEKKFSVEYEEFLQFLKDFKYEYGNEVFRSYDTERNGYIKQNEFKEIMLEYNRHLLTDRVIDFLNEFRQEKISFPFYLAFTSILSNLDEAKKVYLQATNGNEKRNIRINQYHQKAASASIMTPLEIQILYKILHNETGKIILSDLNSITPDPIPLNPDESIPNTNRSSLMAFLETTYRFTLGVIAGAIGATAVYPVDLVKTRMQNQRIGPDGQRIYNHMVDCAIKTVRNEGILGLYSGLLPNLLGAAPAKAVQLTSHDFAQDKLYDNDGNLPLWGEILSGSFAGVCQVSVMNPMEIVKIRLQVAGETGKYIRAAHVVRELGLRGLYKGGFACWLRDIPFNSIYFTAYNHTKSGLANEDGYNSPGSLILAGAIAGIPAASLVTPADVIKTRLQVVAQQGQTVYTGTIADAAKKIYRQEGLGAFWKGVVARVVRSSPQFAVTLFSYELLQRFLKVDFGGRKLAGSSKEDVKAEVVGGYRIMRPILTGIETRFGIMLPNFKS